MGQDNWKKVPMSSVIVGANGKMSFFCGSFMLFPVLCLLCIYARLFICALWSPAGKGLPSWLWFVVSYCEFVTFPMVYWVRCGCYVIKTVKTEEGKL